MSRDRGGGYGEAAARVLPDAIKVADRWHLMENASSAFLGAVRRSMRVIRGATGATTINPELLTCAEKLRYHRGRHVKIIRTGSWEEFEVEIKKFEDPTRKVWDEVWFRGQADAEWPLFTTLERRAPKISAVSAYFHILGNKARSGDIHGRRIRDDQAARYRQRMQRIRSLPIQFCRRHYIHGTSTAQRLSVATAGLDQFAIFGRLLCLRTRTAQR